MNKRKFEFAQELNRQMQEKTFSKVSISDICQSLNCSRQSFYYYFDTIEQCLDYFVKESFKNQIKEDYLISDVFNYFDNNSEFVKICDSDEVARTIFWDGLFHYTKRLLDLIFSKNIVEFVALYAEQKEALVSFYVAGLLEEAKSYVKNGFLPNKDKCISYCKAIMGSGEATRETIARFNR